MTKLDIIRICRENQERMARIYSLEPIRKLSTPEIGCLINYFVEIMEPNTVFVNVGTGAGFQLLSGAVGNPDKECIGVDNWSEMDAEEELLKNMCKFRSKMQFWEMDFREYFIWHTKPIGLYIYDADHSADATYEGLTLAEPFLVTGSNIIIDDWNWECVQEGVNRFMDKHYSNPEPEFQIIYEEKTDVFMEDTSEKKPQFSVMYNGILIIRRNYVSR